MLASATLEEVLAANFNPVHRSHVVLAVGNTGVISCGKQVVFDAGDSHFVNPHSETEKDVTSMPWRSVSQQSVRTFFTVRTRTTVSSHRGRGFRRSRIMVAETTPLGSELSGLSVASWAEA
jgi:hypothetical protein